MHCRNIFAGLALAIPPLASDLIDFPADFKLCAEIEDQIKMGQIFLCMKFLTVSTKFIIYTKVLISISILI
jgi:hypothetical protein